MAIADMKPESTWCGIELNKLGLQAILVSNLTIICGGMIHKWSGCDDRNVIKAINFLLAILVTASFKVLLLISGIGKRGDNDPKSIGLMCALVLYKKINK
jgi:hypothetical protein